MSYPLQVAIVGTSLSALMLFTVPTQGQIGGKTAADGPFLLDDVEDLDLQAGGVDRPWIAQHVSVGGLSAYFLESSSLTLGEEQSPVGALHYQIQSQFGYVNKSYGVPVPSEPGQSTLTFPGDITEFAEFEFLISFTPVMDSQEFWLIMETYPEVEPNVFPRIMWRYYPTAGTTFQRVRIPIHEPTLILDGDGYTLDELLSQTRFMSFYFYGEKLSGSSVQFQAYIDDIKLLPVVIEPDRPSDVWMIYGPAGTADNPQGQNTSTHDDTPPEDSPARL